MAQAELWWKIAQRLDEAQLALAQVLALPLEDPRLARALQDKLREGQGMLFAIFQDLRLVTPAPLASPLPTPPPPAAPPAPFPPRESGPTVAVEAVPGPESDMAGAPLGPGQSAEAIPEFEADLPLESAEGAPEPGVEASVVIVLPEIGAESSDTVPAFSGISPQLEVAFPGMQEAQASVPKA